VNGQASFTTSALVPDHYHIIASYSGDTINGYAAGSTTLVQVVLANPTTTVTTSASPSTVGQSVTFTATVNPNGVFFVPLGTVSFMDGNTLLGTVKLNALDQSTPPSSSQTATFTTSSLAAGNHSITTVYSGDLNFAGGTSSPLTQTVLIATTTSLVDNGPNPSTSGLSVSFVVTVSPAVPNGELVQLDNGGVPISGATGTLTGGTVTINVTSLPVGSDSVTAVYGGDANYHGSTSAAVTQVVNNAPPAVSSVVVNGGAPAYTDSNGLQVSLAGQNSVVEQILVTFNEPVTLSGTPFTVTNDTNTTVSINSGPSPNTAPVTANYAVVPGSNNTQYIVTFSGAGTNPIPGGAGRTIKDGIYYLNVVGANVSANSQTAANSSSGFWALYGSADNNDNSISPTFGDGNSEVFVDIGDFNQFRATYGSESDIPGGPPAYNAAYDSNLDGFVDITDFNKFRTNYGADWSF
jgi:hypothetical protein